MTCLIRVRDLWTSEGHFIAHCSNADSSLLLQCVHVYEPLQGVTHIRQGRNARDHHWTPTKANSMNDRGTCPMSKYDRGALCSRHILN